MALAVRVSEKTPVSPDGPTAASAVPAAAPRRAAQRVRAHLRTTRDSRYSRNDSCAGRARPLARVSIGWRPHLLPPTGAQGGPPLLRIGTPNVGLEPSVPARSHCVLTVLGRVHGSPAHGPC